MSSSGGPARRGRPDKAGSSVLTPPVGMSAVPARGALFEQTRTEFGGDQHLFLGTPEEFVRWAGGEAVDAMTALESAKQSETRERRVAKALDALREGRKRP